ncbi:hypothetical protein PTKIN_Ptkin14bG0193200 [Pterospermum kingtungense]
MLMMPAGGISVHNDFEEGKGSSYRNGPNQTNSNSGSNLQKQWLSPKTIFRVPPLSSTSNDQTLIEHLLALKLCMASFPILGIIPTINMGTAM